MVRKGTAFFIKNNNCQKKNAIKMNPKEKINFNAIFFNADLSVNKQYT
jgi:hypothetical protein